MTWFSRYKQIRDLSPNCVLNYMNSATQKEIMNSVKFKQLRCKSQLRSGGSCLCMNMIDLFIQYNSQNYNTYTFSPLKTKKQIEIRPNYLSFISPFGYSIYINSISMFDSVLSLFLGIYSYIDNMQPFIKGSLDGREYWVSIKSLGVQSLLVYVIPASTMLCVISVICRLLRWSFKFTQNASKVAVVSFQGQKKIVQLFFE